MVDEEKTPAKNVGKKRTKSKKGANTPGRSKYTVELIMVLRVKKILLLILCRCKYVRF